MATVLAFAIKTGIELVFPQNPNINEYVTQNYFGNGLDDML